MVLLNILVPEAVPRERETVEGEDQHGEGSVDVAVAAGQDGVPQGETADTIYHKNCETITILNKKHVYVTIFYLLLG